MRQAPTGLYEHEYLLILSIGGHFLHPNQDSAVEATTPFSLKTDREITTAALNSLSITLQTRWIVPQEWRWQ
jgi:hypothetical protein